MKLPMLAIVVPCFNEEECISSTTNTLLEVLHELESEQEISSDSFILCVNDGSTDTTWSLIEKYNRETKGKVKGIRFSRNFGNQRAILAGLLESSRFDPDCLISIDADLQQDESKIKEFVQKYKNGAKLVLGVRKDRKTDNFLKKTTALAFYKLMNILGVNIKINHSDYRLVSREVVNVLKTFPETNMFLRGIFNDLGFEKDYVFFDVKSRKAGKTKFTSFALFSLALNGITSFSVIPLRMVTFIGFIMAISCFILGLSVIMDKYYFKSAVPGWATIVSALGFIGGMQILCTGIIGEYLGQLFQEVKARPRYIIEQRLD